MKGRYQLMGKENNEESEEDGEDDSDKKNEVFDLESKVMDYGNRRVTEIPTCQRLILPKPAPVREETAMATLRDELLDEAIEFIRNECNEKGYPINSNFSETESAGIREIQQKIKEKEVVVFKTDKSSKLCIDTVENYTEAVKEHIATLQQDVQCRCRYKA